MAKRADNIECCISFNVEMILDIDTVIDWK